MRWLILTCLVLGTILATKSEINEEEKTLTINDFESKDQNIGNIIEEGGLKVQNIALNKNNDKKKADKKEKGKKKPFNKKRPTSNGNKPEKRKKRRNKKTEIQKQKQRPKKPKNKKEKEKKFKKVRNMKGKGKGGDKNKENDKQKKKKHRKKKRKKQIQKKKKKRGKGRTSKKTNKKDKKIKRKEKNEKEKKRKRKKKMKKKKGIKKEIKNNKKSSGVMQRTETCDEIILSRIKLERKAVNYMRQFNRSQRFKGKTDNKLKKKNIWLKSSEKQDPISLLIKCGGDDESNLKCAGSTSNKNSVMMTTLLSNLRNCTPNIGSECDEGKFPAKDAAFDQCAAHLMAYQAKSQECLKKDGAGACACYLTEEAIKLYDNGKACNAPLMQQYERNVLKTKDNCVSKFKDCRKYQDELAVVMMTCCGEGGECPA